MMVTGLFCACETWAVFSGSAESFSEEAAGRLPSGSAAVSGSVDYSEACVWLPDCVPCGRFTPIDSGVGV